MTFSEPKAVIPSTNVAGQHGLHRAVDCTFSASYTTNGEPFTPASFGLSTISYIQPLGACSGGVVPVVDHANSKIKAFWCAGAGAVMTEVTNTTNLSTQTVRCVAVGS